MSRTKYLPGCPLPHDLTRLRNAGLSLAACARELTRLSGHAITRHMVWWWLTEDDRLAQEGECQPAREGPAYRLAIKRRLHQQRRRLGSVSYTLRERESDVLALLCERGPLTRPEIKDALRLRHLKTEGQSWLSLLVGNGLVEVLCLVCRAGRWLWLYASTQSAQRLAWQTCQEVESA